MGSRILFVVLVVVFLHGFVYSDVQARETTKEQKEGQKDEHHIAHRHHSTDETLNSFGWKIMGYLCVIIPGLFAIRMVRTLNFYEREGKGVMYNMIKCCVFGSSDSDQTGRKQVFGCFTGTSTQTNALKLIFCVAGIQISFLTWGVLQEKVMTNEYTSGEDKAYFKNSEFMVFMNRLVALLLSGMYIHLTGANWNGAFYQYSFCSLSNICSSWCQYEALKFVSFPTQVLVKTSKLIPVMIMGKFVLKKVYAYYEYVIAILISAGVSLFLLSTSSDKHASVATTIPGLVLMLGYMVFDSFTSNWQSRLYTEHNVSSMQMMFNINVFSSLLTLMPLLISGGLFYSIAFIRSYPDFAIHVFIMSLASAVGQVFLFFTISEFGPLVFITIMVTRQMFSILLSCLIYGHSFGVQSLIGMLIVFSTLFFKVYAQYRISVTKREEAARRRPDVI